MEGRGAVAPVVAAPRGLAVDGDQGRLLRPALPHPSGEGVGEQRGIDAVHQDREPPFARDAVGVRQVAAQEVDMRDAPVRDVLIVVAIRDGRLLGKIAVDSADHQMLAR